jgi:hypothetical protein
MVSPATLFDQLDEQPVNTGFALGMEKSANAATKWTAEQMLQVDTAIIVASRRFDDFTSEEVWLALPAGFPVTKGMAARLNRAARRGLIVSTGETRRAQRGGRHDHGQRLTVWTRRR